MTTSRTIPPMIASDLDLLLRAAMRFHTLSLDTPTFLRDDPIDLLPPDPRMIPAFHILIHPRFDPALHSGPDADDCPDCLDDLR